MRKYLLSCIALLVVMSLYSRDRIPTDSLSQYTGKYKFPDGSVVTEVTVSLDSSGLTANSVMGSAPLKKVDGDIFEIVGLGGVATFRRSADGKISGVNIVVGDNINIEGTKTEGLRDSFGESLKGLKGL